MTAGATLSPMGGFRVAAPALLGVLLVGCETNDAIDLSENPALYRYTGYQARVPADRAVFMAPVVDDREVRVEEASGSHTVSYFADGSWDRPIADMVDAVLRQEVADSGIFNGMRDRADSDACVLKVRLRRFDVGGESHVTGWRSFAAVKFSVQVYGPGASEEARPLLLEQEFADGAASEVDWRPPPGTTLMGMSLRKVNTQILGTLDQRNVGRTGVPQGLPAEARGNQ